MVGSKEQSIEAGIFLIDKPVGLTSFRIVQFVRRALHIKKVGHAGTLDPFATGLLVVCAGRQATKHISRLMAGEKEYVATLLLGVETDTLDLTGRVVSEHKVGALDSRQIEECLAGFVGRQLQTPPQYSALKHQGKPLYYYARKGVEVEKEPREIEIFELECMGLDENSLSIRVVCSKGTYIRTLAADIGKQLGCGAHLTALRRLRNGSFSVSGAIDGSELQDQEEARAILLKHCFDVEEVLASLIR
jgi:tRNA pseudouridine55 synthase